VGDGTIGVESRPVGRWTRAGPTVERCDPVEFAASSPLSLKTRRPRRSRAGPDRARPSGRERGGRWPAGRVVRIQYWSELRTSPPLRVERAWYTPNWVPGAIT